MVEIGDLEIKLNSTMNLLLENYVSFELDVSDDMKDFLKQKFNNEFEEWTGFQAAFYPENKKESMKRLMSLKDDDNLIAQTVFMGFGQFEKIADILNALMKKNIRINVYVMALLKEAIAKYLRQTQREHTSIPEFKEIKGEPFDDMEKRFLEREDLVDKEKIEFNETIWKIIGFHNIYEVNCCSLESTIIKTPEDLIDEFDD